MKIWSNSRKVHRRSYVQRQLQSFALWNMFTVLWAKFKMFKLHMSVIFALCLISTFVIYFESVTLLKEDEVSITLLPLRFRYEKTEKLTDLRNAFRDVERLKGLSQDSVKLTTTTESESAEVTTVELEVTTKIKVLQDLAQITTIRVNLSTIVPEGVPIENITPVLKGLTPDNPELTTATVKTVPVTNVVGGSKNLTSSAAAANALLASTGAITITVSKIASTVDTAENLVPGAGSTAEIDEPIQNSVKEKENTATFKGLAEDSSEVTTTTTVRPIATNASVSTVVTVIPGSAKTETTESESFEPSENGQSAEITTVRADVKEESPEFNDHMTCKIPILDPFNPEMMKAINEASYGEPYCMDPTGMMFITDHNSHLLRTVNKPGFFDLVNCSYTTYKRGRDDMEVIISEEPKFPITEDITRIPTDHEFIRVQCRKKETGKIAYEDFFGFVHLKPEVEERAALNGDKIPDPEPDQLSVVILGLDSVSHMNFQRFMQGTRKFLQEKLSAIEFYGRNKVHESTFNNIVPTLTGWQTDELQKKLKCWPEQGSYFDKCPFIWKNFIENGYRTVYGEDSIHRSTFLDSTLNGFEHPVADYDFRTLIRGMEKLGGGDGCFRHKSATQVLIDSLAKAATALNNKPYFHFTWITSFTHDAAVAVKYVDPHVIELLKTLTEKQLLNRTVFILMSDHGMTFGQYVQQEQGMLESRMPMLNIVFPAWFLKKYTRAIENMKSNIHRLSTPYDLHEALKDLLNPTKSISNIALAHRETQAYSANRGISLFLPIPLNRTCNMAGIEDHWCICWSKTPVANASQNEEVKTAVQFSLDFLNKKLWGFQNCSRLELEHIVLARQLNPESTEFSKISKNVRKYEVIFQVQPSSGIFESTVVLEGFKLPKMGGPVSRINEYRKQGDCIDTDPRGTLELKSMCHCVGS